MLSSDSPGTFLSLSAKITKLPSFLVTLQALSLSCQSHKTSYTTKSQISHATQLQHNITCSSAVDTYFTLAYHFAFRTGTPSPMPMIFHLSSALWYRASICPRTSQDRCCNSLSKPMRLSFNIMMISKLLRLIRRSPIAVSATPGVRSVSVATLWHLATSLSQ